MFDYSPEPPVEPPEDKYITDVYGHEIYSGEKKFEIYNDELRRYETLCLDCFKEWVTDWLEHNPEDVANKLEVECETVSFVRGDLYGI